MDPGMPIHTDEHRVLDEFVEDTHAFRLHPASIVVLCTYYSVGIRSLQELEEDERGREH